MRDSQPVLRTSASSTADGFRTPPPGRLQPRAVMAYLRQASELSIEPGDDTSLRALVDAAVPALSDEAVLFVLGSDGLLRRAVRARKGQPATSGERLEQEAPIPRDS